MAASVCITFRMGTPRAPARQQTAELETAKSGWAVQHAAAPAHEQHMGHKVRECIVF